MTPTLRFSSNGKKSVNVREIIVSSKYMKMITNLADICCLEEIFTIGSFQTFSDARKINQLFQSQ